MLYDLQNSQFGLENLNPQGSQLAAEYGLTTTHLVQKVYDKIIYDTTPKQFMDVRFLGLLSSDNIASQEFHWGETDYDRIALVVTTATSAVSAPNTVTIPVASVEHISTDMIIASQDNDKAMVIEVDTSGLTITARPLEGSSFPALAAGEELPVLYPGEADGADDISSYYRMDAVERYNNVQLFSRGRTYDEIELKKMESTGTYSNFMAMEAEKVRTHLLIDVSNALWNGTKGVVRNAKGKLVFLTNGIYNMMIEGGSPIVETTPADYVNAMQALVNATNVGEYGEKKFLVGPNKIIQDISRAFKEEKTRYAPDNSMADMMLDEINFGATSVVLMPQNRFMDKASFPAIFGRQAFLIDPELMRRKYIFGPRGGTTPDNRANGYKRRSKEMWMDVDFGLQINNIKAFGILRVSE